MTGLRWDDDLEALVAGVVEHFGQDVFSAAMARAFTAALQHQRPLTLASSRRGGITDGRTVIPLGVFEEAARTELRRLVRPQ